MSVIPEEIISSSIKGLHEPGTLDYQEDYERKVSQALQKLEDHDSTHRLYTILDELLAEIKDLRAYNNRITVKSSYVKKIKNLLLGGVDDNWLYKEGLSESEMKIYELYHLANESLDTFLNRVDVYKELINQSQHNIERNESKICDSGISNKDVSNLKEDIVLMRMNVCNLFLALEIDKEGLDEQFIAMNKLLDKLVPILFPVTNHSIEEALLFLNTQLEKILDTRFELTLRKDIDDNSEYDLSPTIRKEI